MVSREFRCVSMLPLWLRANTGLFWRVLASSAGGPLRLRAATAHAVGRGLRFDAWREFHCVSTLPLWFRANSVAFRRSRTSVAFRRSRCGFARISLRCDAHAVVSREFRCVSMLPLWFRTNSGLFWRVLASPGGAAYRLRAATAHAVGRGLRFDAAAVVSREFRCVSTLPLWFRANSVAFRCSRCGFARIPASSGLLWPLLQGGRLGCGPQRRTRWGGAFVSTLLLWFREFCCVSTLPLWFRTNSVAFRCSRCGFACSPLFRGGPLRFPRTFVFLVFGSVGDFSRPLLASFGLFRPSSLFGVYAVARKASGWTAGA